MHPALRKGPLFYKKTPLIFHFFTKKHFPPFHFLPADLGLFTVNSSAWWTMSVRLCVCVCVCVCLVPKLPLGAACQPRDVCLDRSAVCTDSICQCTAGYFPRARRCGTSLTLLLQSAFWDLRPQSSPSLPLDSVWAMVVVWRWSGILSQLLGAVSCTLVVHNGMRTNIWAVLKFRVRLVFLFFCKGLVLCVCVFYVR